jgi:hypothetical protein
LRLRLHCTTKEKAVNRNLTEAVPSVLSVFLGVRLKTILFSYGGHSCGRPSPKVDLLHFNGAAHLSQQWTHPGGVTEFGGHTSEILNAWM